MPTGVPARLQCRKCIAGDAAPTAGPAGFGTCRKCISGLRPPDYRVTGWRPRLSTTDPHEEKRMTAMLRNTRRSFVALAGLAITTGLGLLPLEAAAAFPDK